MDPFCATPRCYNFRRPRDKHCFACNREFERRHYQRTPERQKRASARNAARRALSEGRLFAQPCEICLSPHVEIHHEDYDKPLQVRWLCGEHHQMVTNRDLYLLPPMPLTAKDIIRNAVIMRGAR